MRATSFSAVVEEYNCTSVFPDLPASKNDATPPPPPSPPSNTWAIHPRTHTASTATPSSKAAVAAVEERERGEGGEGAAAHQSIFEQSNYFSCELYGVEVGKQVSAEVRASRGAYDIVHRILQSLHYTPAGKAAADTQRFTLIRSDGGVGLESGGRYYIRGYNKRVTPWEKRVFLSTRTKSYRDSVWLSRPGGRSTKWTLSWSSDSADNTVANDTNVNIKAAKGNKGWLLNTNRIYKWDKGASHSARTFDDDGSDEDRHFDGAVDDDGSSYDSSTRWIRGDHHEDRALFPSWAKSLTPRETDNERNTIRHYPDSPNWNLRDCRALGTADVTSKDWHELLNVPDNVERAAGRKCTWEREDDDQSPMEPFELTKDDDDDSYSANKCKRRQYKQMGFGGVVGILVGVVIVVFLSSLLLYRIENGHFSLFFLCQPGGACYC